MDRRVLPAESEDKLLDKLRSVEALFAGAATEGERDAAAQARRRILLRLADAEASDPPLEYRFRLEDGWSRKLFTALCRRYGIEVYRYHGQHRSTIMAKVSKRFVEEILWPEYNQIGDLLRKHIDEMTDRIISSAIHDDPSDTPERLLPPPSHT